jgi:hypothetical protein
MKGDVIECPMRFVILSLLWILCLEGEKSLDLDKTNEMPHAITYFGACSIGSSYQNV